MDHFCVKCLGLREAVTTSGTQLQFKCGKCGEIYQAKPEDTLLASEEVGAASFTSKFKYSIRTTAFDPTNPKIKRPCDKCGQQITTYQRMGEKKKLIVVCDCGNIVKK
jgi:DNA-directed RNA polymerase subunit M/transcription elongation factor TFIIS